MFLFDGDYFCERMSEPGGLARYLAEFLVQFYNGVTIGAVIIALLLMLVQRLTWRLMFSASHYALSFIPVTMLWYAIGDENVMLTYVVALAMALAAVWGLGSLFRSWGYDMPATLRKLQVVLVLMPAGSSACPVPDAAGSRLCPCADAAQRAVASLPDDAGHARHQLLSGPSHVALYVDGYSCGDICHWEFCPPVSEGKPEGRIG